MASQAPYTNQLCSFWVTLVVLTCSAACGVVEGPPTPENPLEDLNNNRTSGTNSWNESSADVLDSYQDLVAVSDTATESEPELDTGPNPGSETEPGPGDTTVPSPVDNAELVSVSFPSVLSCGSETTASVTMRNIGSTTWTREDGYKLGAVDDDDPFKLGDARVWLKPDDVVPPGGEYTFIVKMAAGATEGIFTTDWQMVHEGVAWFGETTSNDVEVHCVEGQYVMPLPNMSATVQAYAAAHPDLLANSCQDEPGGSWAFLDGLVDLLRLEDDRWGYNWKRGVIGDPSEDVLDYHYGSGEREGSAEVYIMDVIVGHCGPNPAAGWGDQTQATLDQGEIGRWTGRGRF